MRRAAVASRRLCARRFTHQYIASVRLGRRSVGYSLQLLLQLLLLLLLRLLLLLLLQLETCSMFIAYCLPSASVIVPMTVATTPGVPVCRVPFGV